MPLFSQLLRSYASAAAPRRKHFRGQTPHNPRGVCRAAPSNLTCCLILCLSFHSGAHGVGRRHIKNTLITKHPDRFAYPIPRKYALAGVTTQLRLPACVALKNLYTPALQRQPYFRYVTWSEDRRRRNSTGLLLRVDGCGRFVM